MLDNIFSSFPSNKAITLDVCFSDHRAQLASFIIGPSIDSSNIEYKRSITQENINFFTHLLTKEAFDGFGCANGTDGIDGKFTCFFDTFNELFNIAFPLRLVHKSNNNSKKLNKWITPELVSEGIELRKLHRGLKQSGNSDLLDQYRVSVKAHKKKCKRSKAEL